MHNLIHTVKDKPRSHLIGLVIKRRGKEKTAAHTYRYIDIHVYVSVCMKKSSSTSHS